MYVVTKRRSKERKREKTLCFLSSSCFLLQVNWSTKGRLSSFRLFIDFYPCSLSHISRCLVPSLESAILTRPQEWPSKWVKGREKQQMLPTVVTMMQLLLLSTLSHAVSLFSVPVTRGVYFPLLSKVPALNLLLSDAESDRMMHVSFFRPLVTYSFTFSLYLFW